jgi:hypothetical protein
LSVVGRADVVGCTVVLAAEVAGNAVGADGGLSRCGVKEAVFVLLEALRSDRLVTTGVAGIVCYRASILALSKVGKAGVVCFVTL